MDEALLLLLGKRAVWNRSISYTAGALLSGGQRPGEMGSALPTQCPAAPQLPGTTGILAMSHAGADSWVFLRNSVLLFMSQNSLPAMEGKNKVKALTQGLLAKTLSLQGEREGLMCILYLEDKTSWNSTCPYHYFSFFFFFFVKPVVEIWSKVLPTVTFLRKPPLVGASPPVGWGTDTSSQAPPHELQHRLHLQIRLWLRASA